MLYLRGIVRIFTHLLVTLHLVKLKTRRYIAAWLLLAVFLPMLIFSSLHVHEEDTSTVVTECADCVHHTCHGHMTAATHWAHDCVLCQFLTLTFLATATVSFTFINRTVSVTIDVQQRNVCVARRGIVGLRAPPAFLHLA